LKYLEIYESLIARGVNRTKEADEYYEKHHIIPKCLGGNNSKVNLVYLTAREHYVAHQLLVKVYPTDRNLIFAAHMMTIDSNGKRVNNKDYEWLKKKYSSISRN
jgi:hypothetical protein